MGQSARDSAAEQLNSQLSNANFTSQNRFDNYTPLYNSDQMRSAFNSLFNTQSDAVNSQANSDIAQAQQGTAARLASQGVTGGSILNNAVNQSANNGNKYRYNSLVQLALGRQGQETGLMQDANNLQYRTTAAAQGVDQQNQQNKMNQYNLRMGNLQNMDNTTWLDDVFAGLNTAGNLAGGLSKIPKLFN